MLVFPTELSPIKQILKGIGFWFADKIEAFCAAWPLAKSSIYVEFIRLNYPRLELGWLPPDAFCAFITN